MENAKLLGKVASKLHANYTKQTKGTALKWTELSKEEKRVWMGLARRAGGLFATEQFTPLLKAMGEPNGQAEDYAAAEAVAKTSGEAKDAASGDMNDAAAAEAKDDASGEAKDAASGEAKDAASGEAKDAASGDMNDAASAEAKNDASRSEPKVTSRE